MPALGGGGLKVFIAIIIVALLSCPALAQVSGPCANCHTMHNSQDSEAMAYAIEGGSRVPDTTANKNLLITDCIGCHTGFEADDAYDDVTGAPVVFSIVEPDFGADAGDGKKQGLAGGNFYWVTEDDTHGHNIFTPDANLAHAPGWTSYCYADSCHQNLALPYSAAGTKLTGRRACEGCHMVSGSGTGSLSIIGYHHKPDGDGIADSPEEGWYRFLSGHQAADGHGVSGIEDDDWQLTASATDHNEYLGSDKSKVMSEIMYLTNTMTAFCVGCHGNFHIQDTTANGSRPWIRHPSDKGLPGAMAYTVYDPLVPVARASLSAVSGTVSPGAGVDGVFCLSCHRAHASPYYKMLRWDYKTGDMATDFSGCLKCHTLQGGPVTSDYYPASAHGDYSIGVYRPSIAAHGYERGNCAHCHEMHSSIGGTTPAPASGPTAFLLMGQATTGQGNHWCFYCHVESGSHQSGGITNNSYSHNFGGNPSNYDSNIKEAFSHLNGPGSSHSLSDITSQTLNKTMYDANGSPWSLSGISNCGPCHNQHMAQEDFPVTRPSNRNEVWGDDMVEKMGQYWNYKAPYWYGSTSLYEPLGEGGPASGGNIPDYIKFCTDCHNANNTIYTTNPTYYLGPTNLISFDWDEDVHGGAVGTPDYLKPPYSPDTILNCTDCHEPHGSEDNIYLLRTSVNGITVQVPDQQPESGRKLCESCHSYIHYNGSVRCFGCHRHGNVNF